MRMPSSKMYVAGVICFLAVVANACCIAVVDPKTTDAEADQAIALVKTIASQVAVKQRRSADNELSPSRPLRNSYVRFGRSSAATDDDDVSDADHVTPVEKRSKHYVRFGRDGRNYVRFGRLSMAPRLYDEDELEDGDEEIDQRASGKDYARLARRDGEVIEGGTRFRRAPGSVRQYVRYGRADHQTPQRPLRTASKHYVRFGRSSLESRFSDLDDSEELPTPTVDDKRANGKHYVRFGRSDQSAAVSSEDSGDMVDADSVDEEASVDKKSKHYVRFGRSGLDSDADKRTNYVRFG